MQKQIEKAHIKINSSESDKTNKKNMKLKWKFNPKNCHSYKFKKNI